MDDFKDRENDEKLGDVSELDENIAKLGNKASSFKRGDTMVLIGDYLDDDDDYSQYMSDENADGSADSGQPDGMKENESGDSESVEEAAANAEGTRDDDASSFELSDDQKHVAEENSRRDDVDDSIEDSYISQESNNADRLDEMMRGFEPDKSEEEHRPEYFNEVSSDDDDGYSEEDNVDSLSDDEQESTEEEYGRHYNAGTYEPQKEWNESPEEEPDEGAVTPSRVSRSERSEDSGNAGDRESRKERRNRERKSDTGGGKSGKKGKVLIGILVIVFVLLGIGLFRYTTADTFASSAKVDGVDVGGLTAKQAEQKINEQNNSITLVENGKNLGTVKTSFKYDCESGLRDAIKKAAVNPYVMFKIRSGDGYEVPLKVKSGIQDTAVELAKLDTDNPGNAVTADAYIDLDTMSIVKEVYGVNTDYVKLAKAIARQKDSHPAQTEFKYKDKQFRAEPKVTADDLADELAFDKQYLANGLSVTTPAGSTIKVTPKQLSEVIKYSKNGPKYSKKGAETVAAEVIKKYKSGGNRVKIDTVSGGTVTVTNYKFKENIDESGTADSIYNAAKNGGTAKISATDSIAEKIANRVEVSISSQTVTLVKNNKAVGSWSVVTGGPGHRTPTGLYTIQGKSSPAILKGNNADGSNYESHVTYWMPFNGGIGLHDADGWRSAYGGDIYVNNGSHGCVNMPLSGAETVYKNVSVGTAVVVF